MSYSSTSTTQPSFPPPEATLYDQDEELDDTPSLPSPPMLHGLYETHPAYNTSQDSFPDAGFNHPTELSLAIAEKYSPLDIGQAVIPPQPHHYVWNTLPSGNIHSSTTLPVPDSGEPFAYGTQQASGCRTVMTGNQSTASREPAPHTHGDFSPTRLSASTGGWAIPASPHPDHVVRWYLMCWGAVIVEGPRAFVPQTIYEPPSQGDKRRYVSLATLARPIIFISQDSPQWGIPVSHLLSKRPIPLVGGNEPAFTSCGPSIGIRVQWPGYEPCHKQVVTTDYTSERRMINKERLAKIVARSIEQFMAAMSEQAMQIGSDRRWRVGPLDIRIDDIILVSLHQVSQGSWQPQLRLRRTIGGGVSAGPEGGRY